MAGRGGKRGEWSDIWAARSARDLRADTVELLRGELAEQVNGQRSFSAQRITNELMVKFLTLHNTGYGVNTALALLHSGFGYPPQYAQQPGNGGAASGETTALLHGLATRVLTDDVARLADAKLYTLSPELCDVVMAAAASLTDDDCTLIRAGDMPSPTGLIMLPYSVHSQPGSGEPGDFQAVCWSEPPDLPVFDPQRPRELRYLPGLQLSTYCDPTETVADGSRQQLQHRAEQQGAQLPSLLYSGARTLILADDEQVPTGIVEALLENAVRSRQYAADLARRAGMPEEEIAVEYEPGAAIPDPTNTFPLRFLYAFSRLCAQEIAVSERAKVTHGARLQSERLQTSPDVNVVKLRRQRQQREPGDPRFHSSVDWKTRWIVRMHKVRQWYPSERRHKVLFRGPFVKGPGHLPIAPPKVTVTVVSR